MMNSSATTADGRASAPRPPDLRPLAALLAIAAILRIGVAVFMSDDLRSDPDAYVGLAESLTSGAGYSVPGSDRPTAFRPPLLPLLLAGGMWLGLSQALAAAVINVVSGLVTVTGTWLLGRELRLGAWWLTAAAAVPVIDPLLLRYTTLPMTEVLSAALLTLGLAAFLRFQRSYSVRHGIAAGVCFGLGALCRPALLVTGAIVAAYVALLRLQAHGAGSLRIALSSVVSASVPVMALLVCMLPWIVRNQWQFDRFIPATTHGGYTLLLGNNAVFFRDVVDAPGQPVWSLASLTNWQQDVNQQMTSADVEPGDEVAADHWMYERAKSEIRAQPAMFLKACVLRWKRFWSLTPATESGSAAGLIAGTWYAVLWFGLLGSVFPAVGRHRADCVRLLWAAILSFLILHTFYWTNTRMRAPLTGVFAVLSVTGWRTWLLLLRPKTVEAHV